MKNKFKITTLLHFFSDYMILTAKKYLNIYKKYDYEIINEFKYILSTQRVVVAIMRHISSCTHNS
jgi:hypothetical protein